MGEDAGVIRIPLNSCTVGKAPPVHPYRVTRIFFLLASALLRSFASRIESETTRFNRNPYQTNLRMTTRQPTLLGSSRFLRRPAHAEPEPLRSPGRTSGHGTFFPVSRRKLRRCNVPASTSSVTTVLTTCFSREKRNCTPRSPHSSDWRGGSRMPLITPVNAVVASTGSGVPNPPDTDSAKFLHSRNYTACASISRNPYLFLLLSVGLNPEICWIQSESV